MNRAYWDSVALDYDRNVLSVRDYDVGGLVCRRIAEAAEAWPGGQAADLGCGVGKFTPVLADLFRHVHACACSPRALARARQNCGDRPSVTFSCVDFAREPMPFAPVECVLCVNVLLMPDLDERMRAWRTVINQLTCGGRLVLVVPSVESAHFGYFAAVDARLSAGDSCDESLRAVTTSDATVTGLQHGLHPLEGVPTKHYLREELEHMLTALECDVLSCEKLEYPHLQPATWDWLVTARRRDA